ncbi:MAG: DinB family protein [Bacteroidota bacterium]
MHYSLDDAIDILERTPKVLSTLLKDLPEDWTHSNEGENTWSPFDVVGHLIHGEKTDWVTRTKIILSKETKAFKPFDRFAQFEESKGKNLTQLLEEFQTLRSENVKSLKDLDITSETLEWEGTHPELGKITLRNLLSTWVAHDLGHIAQISRVMAKQYTKEVGVWTQYLGILQK